MGSSKKKKKMYNKHFFCKIYIIYFFLNLHFLLLLPVFKVFFFVPCLSLHSYYMLEIFLEQVIVFSKSYAGRLFFISPLCLILFFVLCLVIILFQTYLLSQKCGLNSGEGPTQGPTLPNLGVGFSH